MLRYNPSTLAWHIKPFTAQPQFTFLTSYSTRNRTVWPQLWLSHETVNFASSCGVLFILVFPEAQCPGGQILRSQSKSAAVESHGRPACWLSRCKPSAHPRQWGLLLRVSADFSWRLGPTCACTAGADGPFGTCHGQNSPEQMGQITDSARSTFPTLCHQCLVLKR